jgi:outer membrane protein TolC
LASHGNLVNVYKSEEKTAQFKREQTVFEIKRMVSELYQRVQMHQSILKIRSEALNASYMHVKMAEKEFSQGVIELGELSRVTEIYNKAQTELVLTINDLKSNYQELEQMCGRSFINYP